MRIISPPSMPAGIVTLISSCRFKTPRPLQLSQGVEGILPVPSQLAQVRTLENCPSMELRVSCTRPEPLQVLQDFISVPGLAPSPLQISHLLTFVIRTSRLPPSTDSLKETSM